MTLQLSWSIEGQQQLSRRLQGVREGMGDWTNAFKQAADELKKIFANDVFSTQGKAIGESWKPLKPQYLAQKLAQGYPADTLVRTGAMKAAFASLVKPDSAEVWNAIAYFKYHQSRQPRKSNLPRRVMMKLGENQREVIVKIFHTHFKKVIEK
jgi:phage gpG-like protein